MSIKLTVPQTQELKPRITVFGVGGAGGNAVNNMIESGLQGVDFVVANTDAQALTSSKAQRIVQDLFGLLHGAPDQLPPEWQQGCDGPEGIKTARRVCDYIAGMTDKFAIEEHQRLFDLHDPRS